MARLVALVIVFTWPLALPNGGDAQETGGSYGGSDWGGGSSSSGGGWSGSSGGGSWSSSSGGGGYSSGGGGGADCAGCSGAEMFGTFVGAGALIVFMRLFRDYKRGLIFRGRGAPVQTVDVSAVSIAIDWRARAQLQKRLAELARSGDTRSMGGLASLLHETVIELRRVEHSWLYAGALNARPADPSAARQTFQNAANEMRSRFKREVVRGHDGSVRTDDPGPVRARADEGAGVVVVTVVVAARGEIPDVAHATDANHLRMLMRAFGAIGAHQLVALEVIWSPAAEDDRMSTAELETLYPELRKIDERSIAGRIFCAYCASPYPAELLECPHCGAPGPAVSGAAPPA